MSNLLKSYWVIVNSEEKRIINSDDLLGEKLENWSSQAPDPLEGAEEGFTGGLAAEQIEGVFEDGEESVIKAENERKEEQYHELLKQAEEELALARLQVAKMKEDALADIEVMKRVTSEEARGHGYTEGFEQGVAEIEKLRAGLQEEQRKLRMEYDQLVDELEPKFVDLLTDIYEQIFHVELKEYGPIVAHLISNTMRNSDENKDFLVHVSRTDYEYVNGQKEEIRVNAASGRANLEIVEDITLSPGECMIETGGGIFDCGLNTQLEGLNKKIKLLSFEKC